MQRLQLVASVIWTMGERGCCSCQIQKEWYHLFTLSAFLAKVIISFNMTLQKYNVGVSHSRLT